MKLIFTGFIFHNVNKLQRDKVSAATGYYKKNSFLIGFFIYSFDTTPYLVLKITPLKILRQPTHRIC